MSRVCSVCNKGQSAGNNVSHSNRKTKRTFNANVQKVKIVKDGKVESDSGQIVPVEELRTAGA